MSDRKCVEKPGTLAQSGPGFVMSRHEMPEV
jgi:hypothetical protein